MLRSVAFEVIGERRIVCDGCEQRVERLLKSVEGVNRVRASMQNQRIDVLFDAARLDLGAIVQRLGDAGYETKVAATS